MGLFSQQTSYPNRVEISGKNQEELIITNLQTNPHLEKTLHRNIAVTVYIFFYSEIHHIPSPYLCGWHVYHPWETRWKDQAPISTSPKRYIEWTYPAKIYKDCNPLLFYRFGASNM